MQGVVGRGCVVNPVSLCAYPPFAFLGLRRPGSGTLDFLESGVSRGGWSLRGVGVDCSAGY